ncbi:chymotrypsin inhibitor-like [Zeugodacus cucurbitae]|uniref:chymotrypsin inhibitor-like n=1 Tax=Zeugodacus cucurbitae TaxID=28588 RepID=UPI0023D8EA14|nr:chymotrypsin inhibitor-like [Zeugodacus cucurbitae]
MNTKSCLLFMLVVCIVGFVSAKPQLIELGSCEENEVFTLCLLGCPATCNNPNPSGILCVQPCVLGCQCRAGYIRNSQGRCVQPEDC